MKKVLAWHFVANDKKLQYGDKRLVKIGKTYSCKGEPELCENGMHASKRLIDALGYAPGHFICRVEISGDIQSETNKLVGRNRKVLAMIDGERVLHLFACKVAMNALQAERKAGREPDPRSFAAIEAKHKYLNGEINATVLSAAERAARSAAWDAAAYAAYAAERAVYAAERAAESAAWDAVYAVYTENVPRSAQNKLLTRMINAEFKKQALSNLSKKKKGKSK